MMNKEAVLLSRKAEKKHLTDKQISEMCLPATMLFYVLEKLQKDEGYELREDVAQALNVATVAPMSDVTPDSKLQYLARRVDRDANAILANANCSDLRATLLAVAYMTLGLVSEGRLQDKDNQAVLVSLALTEEAENDAGDEWGIRADEARRAGKRIMDRAFMLGYFLRLGGDIPS